MCSLVRRWVIRGVMVRLEGVEEDVQRVRRGVLEEVERRRRVEKSDALRMLYI